MEQFIINDDSKLRVEQALAFYDAPTREDWTRQRIKNNEDDIVASISKGIDKMRNGRANELINILCQPDIH